MKKTYFKGTTTRVIICLVLISAVFIIHSCKKDQTQTAVTDTKVMQAKTWYERTFPKNNSTGNPLSTLSVGKQTSGTDFSQLISPDWQHNASYNRLNKEVIELPVDPASKYNFGLKANLKTFNPAYSRTSFLILKDGSGYAAYIMMVVADSAYVNNDLTKLAHNTYRKHDADFSGLVLYFTPKGKFLSSWGYKNGKLQASKDTAATAKPTTGTQQIKSKVLAQQPGTKNTGGKTLAQAPFTLVCEDYDIVYLLMIITIIASTLLQYVIGIPGVAAVHSQVIQVTAERAEAWAQRHLARQKQPRACMLPNGF